MGVTITNLQVRYGKIRVLEDISSCIKTSEILAVIGPNGSGKSTLIKTIAGIITPESGSILIDERDSKTFSRHELGKMIGYVPQDFSYITSVNVLETVILGRRPHVQWALSEHDLSVVSRAMDLLSISHLSGKVLNELSGGEKQKVFIARALAQEPRYYLFDEPTSSLDIRYQIEVFNLMKKIVSSGERSVLVAVHDLNFVYHYADRVILMNKGRIVASGTPYSVMTEGNITEVYGVRMQFLESGSGRYVLPVWG